MSGHQLTEMRERQRADLLHPERVRHRALDVGRGPADPLAAAQGLAGVRGERGFDAHHGRGRAAGPDGRGDPRDEAAAADRHQDQADLRAVGRDLQADGALAGDDRPVVERRDRHVPVPGREFLGRGHPRRQGRLHPHQFRAVVLDRVRLDLRRRPRDHHDRPHAEQGRGVGHRVTVVAAGMGDDSVLPGGLLAGHDRGVGPAQLERPGGLQRLGLDQQRRLEPGHGDQRRADRHPLEPAGRVPYLGQADQPGSVISHSSPLSVTGEVVRILLKVMNWLPLSLGRPRNADQFPEI